MEIKKKDDIFYKEVQRIIESSRAHVAEIVNSEISTLYWNIGKRIKSEILRNKRATYGKEVVKGLAEYLSTEFGKGWSQQQLRHCIKLAEIFKDDKIFSSVSRELSWSHLKIIIYLDDELKRDFYIEMTKLSIGALERCVIELILNYMRGLQLVKNQMRLFNKK